MPVTNYTTINGVIVHENRNGVQRNYRPDTLGNTVALTDAVTTTDTWVYWPFGEVRTRTGTTATPFQFVGTLGYYQNTGSNLAYVRARHYQATRGRWATVDPLWPIENTYDYVDDNPVQAGDPSGLRPVFGGFALRPWPFYGDRTLLFGYANWCGWGRPGDKRFPLPFDCLDACCQAHDADLGNCSCYGQSGRAHCNLRDCARAVDCSKSRRPIECEKARKNIIGAFSALCVLELRGPKPLHGKIGPITVPCYNPCEHRCPPKPLVFVPPIPGC